MQEEAKENTPTPNQGMSKDEMKVVAQEAAMKVMDHGKDILNKSFKRAHSYGKTEYYRMEPDHLYTTVADFGRMLPESKRIVVIGCTGAGKSTLLNVLGGRKLVQNKQTYKREWTQPPLFDASFEVDSVTKKTSFANLRWLGQEEREFIAVDTPGIDDSESAEIDDPKSRERLLEMATDLHNKLLAMKHVDAILILHNDVHGNRLNPLTYTILKMVAEKFKEAGTDVWENVIMAYSKCNDFDHGWRADLDKKKEKLQAKIKEIIPSCNVNIPIIALGGVDLVDESSKETHDLPATSADFEKLWTFMQEAEPLNTMELKVFEGEYAKFEKIIQEKEHAEAQLDARKHFVSVFMKFFMVNIILMMRSIFTPRFLSFLVLYDPNAWYDELVILLVVVHCVGWKKSGLACKIAYDDYAKPLIEPYLQKIQGGAAEKPKAD